LVMGEESGSCDFRFRLLALPFALVGVFFCIICSNAFFGAADFGGRPRPRFLMANLLSGMSSSLSDSSGFDTTDFGLAFRDIAGVFVAPVSRSTTLSSRYCRVSTFLSFITL